MHARYCLGRTGYRVDNGRRTGGPLGSSEVVLARGVFVVARYLEQLPISLVQVICYRLAMELSQALLWRPKTPVEAPLRAGESTIGIADWCHPKG